MVRGHGDDDVPTVVNCEYMVGPGVWKFGFADAALRYFGRRRYLQAVRKVT